MTKKEIIKAFEERKVRTVWDDKEEKWCQKSLRLSVAARRKRGRMTSIEQ